ncbi:MAG: glycosyl hydrolase [Candidatus Bathyarchaeota archaeon]|nr:glycosyl hydrolase [Candidatus Bathyarchaeota archaeon]
MISYELFKSPPPEYRGAPFWSINDYLNPEEAARQIALLDYGGYGGAFFHAREGLATPFLSDEWFKSFEAALNEAKKRGMFVWIYDELWWPSGFAGGIIPALGPKYRAKALIAVPSERAYNGGEILATFKCKLNGEGLPCEYMTAKPNEVGGDYIYLSFISYTAPLGETWFSGMSYVDLLSAEVVGKFLEVAYAPYVERFRGDIGKSIPGVFTDEPNISSSRPIISGFGEHISIPPRGPRFPIFTLPWTDDIVERFRRSYGYNILDKLPELLFDVGNYLKTRYDYWKTVMMMFLEAFSKQIYEWCDKNGLKFTGHYLAEDSLLSQLLCGGAVMPHYEYQHVPGIDHLGMHVWGSLLTAKQVSSVANQLEKRRVLCETYGCTGNYPSFADRKWIGDWLYAMGVNLLNHHLVPYSMRGRRKRDYGLNFHWSQPWWKYNRIIEDYFARLSYMLSIGRRVVNVLMIHPIGSAWAAFSPLNVSKVRELNDLLMALLRSLLSLHVDFDLGDETLMAKYGGVKDGKLLVGKMSYDAVIIPPSLTLEESTVKLLQRFVESGGKLIAISPKPFLVGGERSEKIMDLLNKAVNVDRIDKASINEALKNIPRPIMIEGDEEGDILYHLRLDEESGLLILFLANTSREKPHSIRLFIDGLFKVEEWDAISGERRIHPSEATCGKTTWSINLEPVGSALFILSPSIQLTAGSAEKWIKICEKTVNGAWKIRRLNPNILVLDYCRYRVKGAWSNLMPVWRAHNSIVQNGLGSRFSLRFEFESDIDFKDKSLYLVVEKPECFKIHVNGVKVESKPSGYWLDWNFPMISVSELVGKGLNIIELEGIVELEPELENIYLMGDFGVKADAKGSSKIIEEPSSVDLGDLCQVGYPFYAGEIELIKNISLEKPEGSKVILRLEGLNSSLAIVYVNGEEAGKAILPPYEVDITRLLKTGENEIKLRLVGNLRNALGPLHYKGGDPTFIGPETFKDPANWVDDYVLKPFGVKSIRLLMFRKITSGGKPA